MLWECECFCGKKFKTRYSRLKAGRAASCGCARRDNQRKAVTKHGMSGTKVYKVYRSMLDRCHNRNDSHYHNYGDLGVEVCERWRGPGGFERFIEDMGLPPQPRMSVERKDVTKGYSPDNCVWLLLQLQGRNKRNTVRVELDGMMVPLVEVAERFGINYKTLYQRYRYGLYRGGVPIQPGK